MLTPELHNIITRYFSLQGVTFNGKDPVHQELLKRSVRDAKVVYRMAGRDIAVAYQKMAEISNWASERELEWALSTVIKRWLSDNGTKPKRVYKELPPEKPIDHGRVSQGLENLRDLLKKRGLTSPDK